MIATARPQRVDTPQVLGPRVLLLARIGGLPADAMFPLASPLLADALGALLALEANIESRRSALSDMLHGAIGRLDAGRDRSRLIELRRSLFNGRIPGHDVRAIGSLVSEELALIDAQLAAFAHRDSAAAHVRELYAGEVRRSRTSFQDLIGDTGFQKGLLLSSRALFDNVARYRRAAPASFVSRDEQIERGLLRYFTRAAMKATPFATFCSVVPAEIAGDSAVLAGDPPEPRGVVRLNKSLFGIVWRHLRQRPAVRCRLPVELNPTVTTGDDSLRFLASFDGREVFQRIERQEAIDFVVQWLGQTPGSMLGEIATRLAAEPEIDATESEAMQYLESLLQAGMLRFRGVIGEQDADWDFPLCEFLRPIDDPHAAAVVTLLIDLRVLVDAFGKADVSGRVRLLEELRALIFSGLTALGLAASIPRDLAVYEDASANAVLRIPQTEQTGAMLRAMSELTNVLERVAMTRAQQMEMRFFFDRKYPGHARVPLIQFYEDFYRDHFKAHLDRVRRIKNRDRSEDLRQYDPINPFGLLDVQALRAASEQIGRHIQGRWMSSADAEEINIDLAALEEIAASVPTDAPRPRSFCTFCQVVEDGRAAMTRCVLSHPHFQPGFGKYFSRFLHTLPDEVRAEVFDANAAIAGESILAEIAGDAEFNANLHPPLLRWELTHPSAEDGGLEDRIGVSELDVVLDPNDARRLKLERRSDGRTVYPVDLGFLTLQRRPALYQLLARFSSSSALQMPLPERLRVANGTAQSSPPPVVTRRPRIVVDGRVVVARQRWSIPNELYPVKQPRETGADVFERVWRWRHLHGIPERAYVRIAPKPVSPNVASPNPGAAAPATPVADAAEKTQEFLPTESETDETLDVETEADARAETPAAAPAGAAAASGTKPANPPAPPRQSRDYGKPQFIDFTSPMLVALFVRLPQGVAAFDALIEEAYPDVEHLPVAGSERYVTELLLQLDYDEQLDSTATEVWAR
jgi:hypothetical protein